MRDIKDLREEIEEYTDEAVIIFENPAFVSAFLGLSNDGRAIYDYEEMVRSLSEEDGISEDEARDFISYNTLRALPYMGDKCPIILFRTR